MDPLPLSILNDFLYCPRRAALKLVEGWREANEHTVRGDLVHEHADLAGYESQISNLKSQIIVWRALPVFSDRLGLNGKCDLVEVECLQPTTNLKSQTSNLKFENLKSLKPVEFKLGKRRRFVNDDAQLCAQALCLEEMFGIAVPRGAIFHADSKRRREVEFTDALRQSTENAIASLHSVLGLSELADAKSEIAPLPPAVFKPACEECSLYDICLPQITSQPARLDRLARQLYEISNLKSEIP